MPRQRSPLKKIVSHLPLLSLKNVAAVGGEIAVTGADGDAVVEVYGVNGMLVYRGKSKSVPVPSAGVYVVRVAGKTVKVTVN